MTARSAAAKSSWLIACAVALTGCQGVDRFLPRDETPVLPPAFAVDVPRGPSSQRLGRDGYPLIGALPSTAAPQASSQVVSETQARYADAEARATRDPAGYRRSVSELQDIASRPSTEEREREYQRRVEELRVIAEEQQQRARTR